METNRIYNHQDEELPLSEAYHPGEFLKDEIQVRKIKKSDLAASLGVLPAFLSGLLSGKRNISADMALKIEKILDIDAITLLRMQALYDLVQARKKLKLIS